MDTARTTVTLADDIRNAAARARTHYANNRALWADALVDAALALRAARERLASRPVFMRWLETNGLTDCFNEHDRLWLMRVGHVPEALRTALKATTSVSIYRICRKLEADMALASRRAAAESPTPVAAPAPKLRLITRDDLRTPAQIAIDLPEGFNPNDPAFNVGILPQIVDHCSRDQRAMCAAKSSLNQRDIATFFNVDARRVSDASLVRHNCIPAVVQAIEAGELMLLTAHRFLLKVPQAEQEQRLVEILARPKNATGRPMKPRNERRAPARYIPTTPATGRERAKVERVVERLIDSIWHNAEVLAPYALDNLAPEQIKKLTDTIRILRRVRRLGTGENENGEHSNNGHETTD